MSASPRGSGGRPPEFLRRLEAIAASLDPATLERDLGIMCRKSLFFAVRDGEPVTQGEIDAASRAFLTTTERLLPPSVVHGFIEHAIATRLLPEIDAIELAPGFTEDETLAGTDAVTRAQNPLKKFTREEVLACLRWNQREPAVPTALAHFVDLVHTAAALLADLAGRRSPEVADGLAPFVAQWRPKNVVKFVNVALFVAGSRRARGGPIVIDQATVNDALTLLHRAGAFTWNSRDDGAVATAPPLRIHCPAQAFLHKVLAHQATLTPLVRFMAVEARRSPVAPEVGASLAFVRDAAIAEERGILEHGARWAELKLAKGRESRAAISGAHSDSR